MNRRDFVLLSIGGAGTVAVSSLAPTDLREVRTSPASSGVSAAGLLAAAGTARRLRLVWLKVTFGWARSSLQAANSDPLVVRAVCDELFRHGTERVTIIDRFYQPRTLVERANGFNAALSDDPRIELASLPCIDQRTSDQALLRRDPDGILSLEPAKHHVRAGFSGILRPSEALPATSRPRWIGGFLDATRVLRRGGPEGGSESDVSLVGRLAWSTDAVLLDAWGRHVAKWGST